jgi:phosphoglycerol transferase MdoB-like AlkP superfamily enzyme
LQVPAWGAATQRTEFAFLTGLPEDVLGLDRHNPYLRFAKQPVWSVAHDLRDLGYRTTCVHPFFGSFFGRDRVMPNLGFDEFLDIAAFQDAPRFGPYVSDISIADKIAELLQQTEEPRFIFAITMENHGQWQKDRLPPEEIAQVQALAPGFPWEFLCYVRHLQNADEMIGRVAAAMRNRGDGVLCMFGDHVPSFPKLFKRANFTDPRSDYFIWRPDHAGATVTRNVNVVDLSDLLLSTAQIEVTRAGGIEPHFVTRPGAARHPSALQSPSALPDGLAKPKGNIKAA